MHFDMPKVDKYEYHSEFVLQSLTFVDCRVVGIYDPYPDRMDMHNLVNYEQADDVSIRSSFWTPNWASRYWI